MDLDRLMTRLNPVISSLLRSPLHRLLSAGLVLVEVQGRRTGRLYWIPVGYQRDGATITVLVSHARRKQWWRNYQEPAPIRVLLRGRIVRGRAEVVTPGSTAFNAAFEATFRRLPGLGSQFGIRYDRRTGLTASQCEVLAKSGAVVSIDVGDVSES